MFILDLTKNNERSSFIYIPNVFNDEDISDVYNLCENIQFISGNSYKGKNIRRKQIWFEERGRYFCENWKGRYDRWMGNKYSKLLYKIQENVTKHVKKIINTNTNTNFNSCLINKYENGKDIIAAHRDSVESFGDHPIIANISIGVTRILRVKDIESKKIVADISLCDNSMFIMSGASQLYYTHEIIESDGDGYRYSLTFREKL
jgi:hypothetical protein